MSPSQTSSTRKLTIGVHRDGRRCTTNPTIAPNVTSRLTLATVRIVEFIKAVRSM